MTTLTLVRHGQTDWNLHRRIQGTTDIPLNATGEEQARAAVALLSGSRPDAIYASPLVRARRTAQIIAAELSLDEPGLSADMRERSFGEAEGIDVADYLARYGGWHAPVPGAETLAQVAERALGALDEIARETRRRSSPRAESVVVVTHGGVIRALIDRVSGGTLPLENDPILNGSAHRFRWAPGLLQIVTSEARSTAH